MTRLSRIFIATLIVTSTAACAGESGDTLSVDCGGKCDGWDDIKSLVRNHEDINVDDLVKMGAPYATDTVNDALASIDFLSLRITEPEVYDAEQLSRIYSGLALNLGEKELSTQVQKVRADHLNGSGDVAYVESAFRINSDVGANFSFEAGGLADGSSALVNLGFFAGAKLESRVVRAVENVSEGILKSPLRAMRESSRGFIMPRSLEDIRDLKPGEVIALRGEGAAGVNVGVGAPFLIASPSSLAYNLVVTLNVKTMVKGMLDIQLVRMEGDEVVVDVGIERGGIIYGRLGLEDSWGVQAPMELNVNLGLTQDDLASLAEKAVEKQLNTRLNLLSGHASRNAQILRSSLARVRFHLDSGDPEEVAAAIAQAMRGDIRLAQGLSHRGEPHETGVSSEFDLVRSGVSVASSAGIDIFGISLFRRKIEEEGSIVVQTPGGARTIMFQSFEKETGSWNRKHGYNRVGLSSLLFDPNNQAAPEGEANLQLQITETDGTMNRDDWIDQLDGIIVALAGPAALFLVESYGNDMERMVETACAGADLGADCYYDMFEHPQIVALRASASDALFNATSDLEADIRDMVLTAGEYRLSAQSVAEYRAEISGPKANLVMDFRLDEGALAEVMAEGAEARMKSAMSNYLMAVEVDRQSSTLDIDQKRQELQKDKDVASIAAQFKTYASAYRTVKSIEGATIDTLGGAGSRLAEISFDVDSSNRPIYESAISRSLPERRAEILTDMYDDLYESANDWDAHREEVVFYSLLSMVSQERTEFRFQLSMNLEDDYNYKTAGYPESDDIYVEGSKVAPINGGLFNLDQLMSCQNAESSVVGCFD